MAALSTRIVLINCIWTRFGVLTYLSTTQNLVAGEVEDVEDELRHRVPPDPQEDRLAVLDEEETMTLQPF